MSKRSFLFLLLVVIVSQLNAQNNVGINNPTPDASALLDLTSNNKGLLVPRMLSSERLSIATPATGLLVFDTGLNSFMYYNGTQWTEIQGGDDNDWSRNATGIYNSVDNVAIGRDEADVALHVENGKNVLFGDSLSGSGFKMIYYGQKGALRFGYLTNPFGGYGYDRFWDYDSVGYYSFAGGQNSRAKGFGSFAFGSFGWADGSGSVAFFGNAKGNGSFTFGGSSKGRGSITFEGTAEEEGGIAMYGYTGGRYGVSIGGGTTGLGASSSRADYAIAIGWNSDARGQASVALGPSDAWGYNSFATGWVTNAHGNYSSTFGYRTDSRAYASMAMGRYNVITGDSVGWTSTDPIFMIGDGTSNTNRSNSFMVQKNGQTAIGYNAPVGFLNVSTALGSINNSGLDATNSSILIGTTSTGMAFDANQIETIGSDLNLNYNSAFDVLMVNGGGNVGIRHNAPSSKLHVKGSGFTSSTSVFRVENSNNSTPIMFVRDDRRIGINTTAPNAQVQIKGIGTGTTQSFRIENAGSANPIMMVRDDGLVGINDASPTEMLSIGTTTGAGINIGSAEVIEDGGSNTFLFNADLDPNSFMIRDMGATILNTWDDIFADNFVNVSDERSKQDMEPLPYGLEEVLKMKTIRYKLIDDPFKEVKVGLSAQNLLGLVPEAVKTHNYENTDESDPAVFEKIELERMGVTYNQLIPVLIKAIQEQQNEIETLKNEVKTLKQQ